METFDSSFLLFLVTAAVLATIFAVLYFISKNHKINRRKKNKET